jgi:tetratricopeptide (TPR) repeat protein
MRENIPSILKLIVAVSLATLSAQVEALTPDQVFDKVKNSIVVAKTLDAQGGAMGEIKPSRRTDTNKGPSPSEWVKRTTALHKFKDWQGMLEWCLKWTKNEPKNADAWYNLGVACANLKRYNDAIDAYRQAIRINPKDAGSWNNLGIVYDELKRYNDAIDAYRQAIRINPKDVSAWTNLGATYFVSGNRSAALDAVWELRRLDPEKADRLLNAMSR